MPKGTKLRFALITEELLEKLRPSPEPTIPIRSAVKEVLSEVMSELNLNQMIEDKLVELLERRGIASSQSPSDCRSLGGLALAKKTSVLSMPIESFSSVSPRPSEVRKHRKSQERLQLSPAPVAAKKNRTRSQTIFIQPTHREVTFSLGDSTSTHRDATQSDAGATSREAAAPTYRDAAATQRDGAATHRHSSSARRDSVSPHRDAAATQREVAVLYRDVASSQRRAESKSHSYRKFLSFDQQQDYVRRKSLRKK
ncbi:uncharacterized protein LOC111074378 [Drosophila obscura]|uniref:uncharacterized protein LOC111074378 n=1 Tax=Drosophila obscura TaxID=7282 RepID=UPI001BB24DE1|nr:uncharacterized protein LOC111074378 [Drosophila obscura]